MAFIAEKLDELKDDIVRDVTAELKDFADETSYTTVWRVLEDKGIPVICQIFASRVPELKDKNFDYGIKGKEKNRTADLAVRTDSENIIISVKTARKGRNSENDLGTLRSYPEKKAAFTASFDLWIRYDDSGGSVK